MCLMAMLLLMATPMMAGEFNFGEALKNFYESTGHRYVSTHPMFGPTFAHLNALSQKKSIIPFVSTFVFAAVIKHQDAPGTTSKRHMNYLTRIRKNVND